MTNITLAPIALFTYKRLRHTQQTIEALQKNELASESELFIFSDGPRSDRDGDAVAAVRNYIKKVNGFRQVTVIEREFNFGLARSIIDGVTDIVNRYARVIVLEDDLVTSPFFLKYMNEALERYKNEKSVISIHGYLYPVSARLPETFFLRGADCWGWATWKRGWDIFEPDGRKLLNQLRAAQLVKEFDLNGAYSYTAMLKSQCRGMIDSWAIRWHASAFLAGKLTLFPGRSLVSNIGFDSSGTHCSPTSQFDVPLAGEPIKIEPIPIKEHADATRALENYYRTMQIPFFKKVYRAIRLLLIRTNIVPK